MKVLILAAGYGTRLYPLVKDTPKSLLEINKKFLIDYILEHIENIDGVSEVLVVTNHKFHSHFEKWQETHRNFICPIKIIDDQTETNEQRLGSIGDINYVLNHHPINEDILIVGGDNIFDFNIQDYIQFAQSKSGSVSMGVYDIGNYETAKLFGVVAINSQNKIIAFEEKPQIPQSTLIAMCFYYIPAKLLSSFQEYLTQVKKSDTTGDYIRWLAQKKDVYGFKFLGKWYDIGSIESYQEAQKAFANKK